MFCSVVRNIETVNVVVYHEQQTKKNKWNRKSGEAANNIKWKWQTHYYDGKATSCDAPASYLEKLNQDEFPCYQNNFVSTNRYVGHK